MIMAKKPQPTSATKKPVSTVGVTTDRSAPTPPTGKAKSPLVIGIAVAAVVGLLAVTAVIATSKDKKTTVTSSGTDAATGASTPGLPTPAVTVETAAVTVTGASLAPMPDSGADVSVGAAAPRLDGKRFDSSAISIVPGSEPMVVVFVAHWCPHCQREVPLLAKWAVGGASNGVAVRAVSTSVSPDRPNYPPSEWLSRENFTIPTLVDSETFAASNAYGLTSFPYFVALDAKGNVVNRASGEITEAQFAQLLATAKGAA
jgi:cytochrome c biogenesis protein CcmG, thiol:disulfide interchange protein DsbE